MEKNNWIYISSIDQLEENIPVKCKLKEKNIILIKKGQHIIAIEDYCPHSGAPLSDGIIYQNKIICPWHNAAFHLPSGELLLPPALDHLTVFPTKTEGNDIYVQLEPIEKPKKPPVKKNETIVIIGGGAAGNSAAETLRNQGFGGKIYLISKENSIPYDRPKLSKSFLAGKVNLQKTV
jgi:apoptosis-inducing factor 3